MNKFGSTSSLARNYDLAASTYELTGHLFSTGQIRAAKFVQLDWIEPNSKLLYLGCGTGEEVVAAAARGFQVTAVDISREMLIRLEKRLYTRGLSAELFNESVFEFEPNTKFDAVAANFFFNIFFGDDLNRVIQCALSFLEPTGSLLVADVALPRGIWPARAFNWCYINSAQLLASFAGLVKLHRNHDYLAIFNSLDCEIVRCDYFRFCRVGPILFQSLQVRSLASN
ncbi:MAG TPA: class I SAM-dependent methyltransferase [Pirellulaceae bacterium]|nr:class I SAM-dependent methyltransferase [Pirellulaceae bacterium]HMO90894.1 class I SAM-dependent methyltransferase [Pirellulaceae bacterium]HMP68630.1 class I SAM-dependent methyltransferase [Pirellulaceae bacterium]